jgi:hypothetical protein
LTPEELQVLAELLRLDPRLLPALTRLLVDQASTGPDDPDDAVERAVTAVRAAEARVRATFICHSFREWEIVVGHRDHHRAPGMVLLEVGDHVRLISARTYLMVPVQVTHLPETSRNYYRGIIVDLEATSMQYRPGDGVKFGEDQVVLGDESRRLRRPRHGR